MNLLFRPAVQSDFSTAVDCIRGPLYYSQTHRDKTLALWNTAVTNYWAPAVTVEDIDKSFGCEIVAFAIGVFIHDWFRVVLAEQSYSYLGDLLFDSVWLNRSPFLTVAEVKRHNAERGLTLLTLNSGLPPRLFREPAAAPLIAQAGRLFHFGAFGYRLNESIVEAFGPVEREWLTASGSTILHAGCDSANGPDQMRGYVMSLTKESAVRPLAGVFGTAFHFVPPKCCFTAAEQELLLFALSGLTDEELASSLNISIPAVRKRWESIYLKATDCGLIAEHYQKKRRLLSYLEYHMEELRPYPKRPMAMR